MDRLRDGVLYGTYGAGACWVDDDYTFFSGYDNELQKPMWYSTMMPRHCVPDDKIVSGRFMPGVDYPLWKVTFEYRWDHPARMPPQIYKRADSTQQEDISADPTVLAECRRRMAEAIEKEGAPPEQLRRLLLEP